jgi:hypothetical protein
MAEIKDRKSWHDGLGKDVVQEWLMDPCTVAMRAGLADALAQAKDAAISVVSYPGADSTERFAGKARDAGAIIMTLQSVVDSIDGAETHANS